MSRRRSCPDWSCVGRRQCRGEWSCVRSRSRRAIGCCGWCGGRRGRSWRGVGRRLAESGRHRELRQTAGRKRLADYLVAEGVVTDISHEGLRALLHEEGVRFHALRTWKRSNDPDFETKKNRILELYALAEAGLAVVICLDEFGPLNLQPQAGGRAWAPRAKPRRIRATYTRPHGVRHLLAGYDVGRDRLYGHVHKRPLHPLAHRRRYGYAILDNLSQRIDRFYYAPWPTLHNVELANTPQYLPSTTKAGPNRRFGLPTTVRDGARTRDLPDHSVRRRSGGFARRELRRPEPVHQAGSRHVPGIPPALIGRVSEKAAIATERRALRRRASPRTARTSGRCRTAPRLRAGLRSGVGRRAPPCRRSRSTVHRPA